MKEYFPSPREVVIYIQDELKTGRWNWSNMPAPERNEEDREELEFPEPVEIEHQDDFDFSEATLTSVNPEVLVSQGEQIFNDLKINKSLEDIAAEANLILPQFHRLMSMGYNAAESSYRAGCTWYGITTDWKLYRYQYLPSVNMITVCENVPTSRLQELVMAIALKSGMTISFSYGENLEDKEIKLLSQGFTIQEEAARYLIVNMPADEVITRCVVRQNQFQW